MNQLDAALTALAYRDGAARRTGAYRHRRLTQDAIALVLWQLGSEPFAAAAIGYGVLPNAPVTVVAGDPRSRDLAFAALMTFAQWFLPRFEGPAERRETIVRGTWKVERALDLPQILVANRETVDFIGRLGRRLAYLSMAGDRPAPQELVQLGRHLLFVHRHAGEPGQQLIVPIGELLAQHWATPQSDFERASLPALDAFITPPAGLSGFEAAALAEMRPAGPAPTGDDDTAVESLVNAFNEGRARRTDRVTVDPLLPAILSHYERLVDPTWRLIQRAVERERGYPEAASVQRRWDEDREAYSRHMDWMARGGHRRTRQTARQAIETMRRLEDQKARVVAEEALDDPVRMIPWLLDGKAIEGTVVSVNPDYEEIAKVRAVRRPLVTIRAETPRPVPVGKELWRTTSPAGASWVVHEVTPDPKGSWRITLKLMTSAKTQLPLVGATECFSVHHFQSEFRRRGLAYDAPWALQPAQSLTEPAPIESEEAA